MNAVILSAHGVPVTTSVAIADGTVNDHASVIKLVRTYQSDLEDFGRVGFEIQPFETAGGTQQREIAILNEQQATLLITYMRNTDIVRSFKKRLVRDFWALRVPVQPAAPTTASMFMQSAHIMLEMESRTAALEKQQIALTARLDEVVENNVLKVCPQNAEPITHIRKRINKMFGLSASVIDEAMRQLPYSPKPAGMVLNDNEAAQGSHYAVFWVKDVSTMFKRFVAECQRETTAFVSHPFIDARFRLAAGKECK